MGNSEQGERSSAEAAFRRSYQRQFAFVVWAVRRFGVPGADAEDVAQEVFLVLRRRLRDVDAEAGLATWLYRAARRVSSNHRRSLARRSRWSVPLDRSAETALADTRPAPDERLVSYQALRDLAHGIRRLEPAQRTVFVLSEIDGMTAAEIAHELQIPANTVSSRLRLARRDLRRMLAVTPVEASPSADAQDEQNVR